MSKRIISYDLGTSGNKASLYDLDGNCLCSAFVPYETYYPNAGWHEQRPDDWWNAVVESTKKLLEKSGEDKENIECLAISGHSLGAVPIGEQGDLLREKTPIWSDVRADKQVNLFFSKIDYDNWYQVTGNGFPPACYAIFKIMWYQNNEPELFQKVYKILGTKDYINYKLTGVMKTDFSYASGSGVYDLKKWEYRKDFIEASGIPASVLPDIVPSTEVLGTINNNAAKLIGLSTSVKVVCGGVDNSCMALGAKNIEDGRVYTSLGSSSWIAVSSNEPVLDTELKPYVFAHVIPGMFTSAVSIFAAGTSLKWLRDNVCNDLKQEAEKLGVDAYAYMDTFAEQSPIGANRLLFNPSLAGGTSQDASVNIRGAYMGLDLKHGKSDMIRSCMEGIAMNLRLRLDVLRRYCKLQDDMLMVGGGSRSPLYLRIFADVYNTRIIKTNIDMDAGSLGAAAIAAVGCGFWKDFAKIDEVHKLVKNVEPDTENNLKYEQLLPIFDFAAKCEAKISDMLHDVKL